MRCSVPDFNTSFWCLFVSHCEDGLNDSKFHGPAHLFDDWYLFWTVSVLCDYPSEHFNIVVENRIQMFPILCKHLQGTPYENWTLPCTVKRFPLFLIFQWPRAPLCQELGSCDLVRLSNFKPYLHSKRTEIM